MDMEERLGEPAPPVIATLHFFQALQIPDQDTPISACYQMRCDSDSLLLYLSDSTLFHYKL